MCEGRIRIRRRMHRCWEKVMEVEVMLQDVVVHEEVGALLAA